MPATHRIIHVEETGSTNSDAMRLALSGEPLPLWMLADRQSAGRGRAGRSWIGGEGNLLASLAVLCAAPREKAGHISLVAGIALIDAILAKFRIAQSFRLRLKWPNDLLMGAAKAGGILVESTSARGEPGFLAVIGFGVNIAAAPGELPRDVAALSMVGLDCRPCEVLEALIEQMDKWLEIWDSGRGFSAIRDAWIARAGPLGEPITINMGTTVVSGAYRGLSADGGLLLDIDGETRVFTYGDVSLGLAPEPRGDA